VRVLALRFLNSLDETRARITLNLRIYREAEPGVRKCRMKTFPFAIVYRCDAGEWHRSRWLKPGGTATLTGALGGVNAGASGPALKHEPPSYVAGRVQG
jgi:hypothetical protein